MSGLVNFAELGASNPTAQLPASTAPPPIPSGIEALRARALNPVYCDSIETRMALVCELIYQTYADLVTRKRFY